MTDKMRVCLDAGFKVAIYATPRHSDRLSVDWAEHHFPLKKVVKTLIASRMQLGLSMQAVMLVKERLRNKTWTLHTWGRPGHIQLYIEYGEAYQGIVVERY